MSKILAKSGDSLADLYDVEGSIAGISELQSKDVNLVHEMGAVLHSERLSTVMIDVSTGPVLQTILFTESFELTIAHSRLLGVQIFTTDSARVSIAQVSITSPPGIDNADMPIFVWDAAEDVARTVDILVDGQITLGELLMPLNQSWIPNLLVGPDSPRPANILTLRGRTTSFGAGDVTTRMLLYVAFPEVAGLSSRGLPIPSW